MNRAFSPRTARRPKRPSTSARPKVAGVQVFVAAAGGAAHLAGAVAAHTVLPVLGVPMKGWALDGLDSLLSTVQMPRGIPVGTLAIGKAGAVNAGLLAVSILSLSRPELREKLQAQRRREAGTDPRRETGRTSDAVFANSAVDRQRMRSVAESPLFAGGQRES